LKFRVILSHDIPTASKRRCEPYFLITIDFVRKNLFHWLFDNLFNIYLAKILNLFDLIFFGKTQVIFGAPNRKLTAYLDHKIIDTMNLKPFFFAILLLCFCETTFAQDGNIAFGLDAGTGKSKISNINTVILSEPYFLNYHLYNNWKWGYPHAGAFVDVKLPVEPFFVFAEISYDAEAGSLYFTNSYQYNYTMNFNYQYINLTPMIGVDPEIGTNSTLRVAAGIQYGLNATENQITFKSQSSPGYQPAFGTDLEQQQQLRNVLKGKDEFGLVGSIGATFKEFGLEARGHLGTKNVVDVEDNSYNFVPQHCITYAVELLVSYRLPLSSR
jgi:hypothetical protein